MKKIILFFLMACVTLITYSQEFSSPEYVLLNDRSELKSDIKSFRITHSVSQIIDPGTSVSCNSNGVHYNNSYYRVFDLANEFNVNGDWILQNIEIGIAQAVSGAGVSQPISVIFYVMSEYDNELITDSLTRKGDSLLLDVFNYESGTLKNIEAPPGISVIFGQVLVIEVFTPDGHPEGHSFFIGSNDLGETDSTYIMAEHCGIDEPVPMSDILYPDMHMVLNLYGEYENPIPEILSFNIPGQLNDTEIINEPDWTIYIVVPADEELTALSPVITLPAGFQVFPASGEEVDFSAGPVSYEVNNEFGKVSQTWDVTVVNAGPEILDIELININGDITIDTENFTVSVPVNIGTNLSDLSPEIITYDGFTTEPESGSSQDFSLGPVIYTVSHESLPVTQDWELTIFEFEGTGLKDINPEIVKIFPNPADKFIQFDVPDITKIEIYDIRGNLKLTKCSVEGLNVSELADGIYIIKLISNEYIYIEKLIISH